MEPLLNSGRIFPLPNKNGVFSLISAGGSVSVRLPSIAPSGAADGPFLSVELAFFGFCDILLPKRSGSCPLEAMLSVVLALSREVSGSKFTYHLMSCFPKLFSVKRSNPASFIFVIKLFAEIDLPPSTSSNICLIFDIAFLTIALFGAILSLCLTDCKAALAMIFSSCGSPR